MKKKLTLEEQFEFARKAMDGDMDAWGVLYEAYYDFIRIKVFKEINCGAGDETEIAKDLTSEIFEDTHGKLLKGIYNFENSFFTFIWNFSARWKILKYWEEKNQISEVRSKPEFDNDEDIYPSSSGSGYMSEENWNLIDIVLISSAKPHHIIVFFLSSVLEIGYKDIENYFCDLSLISISNKIKDLYLSYFPNDVDMSQYDKYFESMFEKMNEETKNVYKEREYAELRKKYLHVGEIPLRDFIGNKSGNDLSNKFSDWCYDTSILVWEKSLGLFDRCNLLLTYGGNFEPHKVITCCYLKLIKENRKSLAENSNGKGLKDLTDSFYETYFSHRLNGSNNSDFKKYLKPLYDRLDMKFENVYLKPEYSFDSKYEACKNKKTGNLKLDNFYVECFKPGRKSYKSECLKKWSDAVRKEVYKKHKSRI